MSLSNNFPSIRPSLLLDFANTQSLDPRITFTRASTATYYDGVTVAKAEENLLTFSEQFDNAAWTTESVVKTANSAVAPDGNTTADTLADDANTTVHQTRNVTGVSIPNTAVTASVFLKNNTRQFGCLSIYDGSTYHGIVVDLTNGTITQTNGTLTSSSVTSVGNGWYRLAITRTINATTFLSITTSNSGTPSLLNGRPSYTGDGSSIYLWGAQLEQRSSVTAYTATTTAPITNYIPVLLTAQNNIPRFEHNPVTGESLGLEIEEQRTNLCLRSEDFSTTWTNINSTEATNVVIAPDGTLTGDLLIPDTTAGQHRIEQSISITSGITYTFSVYAKYAGYQFLGLRTSNDQGTGWYDLINGTASGAGATITSVGNGWYRCVITATANATGAAPVRINASLDGTLSVYSGNGFSGIYIWGAQLEAGSFATSYIKTEGSQVTRSADSASMTGTNFSSWFNNGEGTFYCETALMDVSTTAANHFVAALGSAGDISNSVMLGRRIGGGSTSASQLYIRNNAVDQVFISNAGVITSANTFIKTAGAYATNNAGLVTNAGTAATDTSVTLSPAISNLYIGWVGSSGFLNGTIKKLAYYPARLTDAQLQALTSA